jgi:tRNA U34 5-carboxymethylaminomethyl modifying enzyme MnmG/GidA
VSGISTEIKSLYNSYKPETLASFARIPGVTPASVAIVRIFIKQHLSSK